MSKLNVFLYIIALFCIVFIIYIFIHKYSFLNNDILRANDDFSNLEQSNSVNKNLKHKFNSL